MKKNTFTYHLVLVAYLLCIQHLISQKSLYPDLFEDSISLQKKLIINRWTKDKIYSNFGHPYVSKESNEAWVIEIMDTKNRFIRIKHEFTGLYIKSFLDSMYLSSLDMDPDAAIWRLEKYNSYYRIAHVKTGLYLNTETKKLNLSKSNPGYFSSHWVFIDASLPFNSNSVYSIINRWTKEKLTLTPGWPTVSANADDGWIIHKMESSAGLVRFQHQSSKKYFKSFNDSLYVDNLEPAADRATWRIERYGDYYRIVNLASATIPNNGYLNIEKKRLHANEVVPTWFSNQWSIEPKK